MVISLISQSNSAEERERENETVDLLNSQVSLMSVAQLRDCFQR